MQVDPNSSLDRRQFLRMGAAGVGGWVLAGASAASANSEQKARTSRGAETKQAAAVYGPLSIAYWQRSERLPKLDWATAQEGFDPESQILPPLIPATLMPQGDPQLDYSGVLLTLHGLFPRVEDLQQLRERASVLLDILHEPVDLQDPPLIHRAWNLRGGEWPSLSSPAKSFVPLWQTDSSLVLQGDLRSPVEGSSTSKVPLKPGQSPPPARLRRQKFGARLTTGNTRGAPKLRRGFYILGMPVKLAESPPDWNGDPAQLSSPEFTCLLMSVEPAGRS